MALPLFRSLSPTARRAWFHRCSFEQLEDRRLLSAALVAGLDSSGHAGPGELTPFAGQLFFRADGAGKGTELWRSDGTAAGTVLVKDINPGEAGSDPHAFTPVGNLLFFVADDGIHGPEVWKTDGTTAGTVVVKDIRAGHGPGQPPGELTAVGNRLCFTADDGVHGPELWRTDGTATGTVLVADLNPGSPGSAPHALVADGNAVYFAAGTGPSGASDQALYRSDGTAAGTVRVKDIRPGSGSALDGTLSDRPVPFAGRVYFAAADDIHGRELWSTDGTAAGTMLVRDIAPGQDALGGPAGSDPTGLTVFAGSLYFAADDGVHGRELWKTDGTAAGTVLVSDLAPGAFGVAPADLTVAGNTLFFRAGAASFGDGAAQLFVSDGTEAGTVAVREVNHDFVGAVLSALTAVGKDVYFAADDSVHGLELWRSDGTAGGTVLVQDLNPGAGDGLSSPVDLVTLGDALYFAGSDGTPGSGLWRLPLTGQPAARNDDFRIAEDTPLVLAAPGVLANDDGAGGPRRATLDAGPRHGRLALAADGSFTYTADPDFNGIDRFTYTAAGGNVAEVSITVVPVDDAPVAVHDTFRVTPGIAPGVPGPGVLANDADVDGDPLTAELVDGPAHGTLELNADGSFTYTVDPGFVGKTDQFTYRATDGTLASSPATVTLLLNAPPTTTDDAYALLQDSELRVHPAGVLANDTDPDGDPLTAQVVDAPAHGTVVLGADGSLTYIPTAGFAGSDRFTYRADDGAAPGNTATVTLTIQPRPTARTDTYAGVHDAPLRAAAPGVLANDSDPVGKELAAVLDFGPDRGTLAFRADGSFDYAPPAGFTGEVRFTYHVTNGTTDSAPTAVVVRVVGRAGARGDDYGEVEPGKILDVVAPGVLANDRDPLGLPLTARLATGPRHGSLELRPDGSFTYTADATSPGDDSFTYVAANGFADSAPVTVTLTRSVFVPLDPTFERFDAHIDLFGNRVLTVQAFGDPSHPVFGFFDTGASAVSFSAGDLDELARQGVAVPARTPGGASSQGVGGAITGDVSSAGTVFVDGLHAGLTTEASGEPRVEFHLDTGALAAPSVRAFLGTDPGSPLLPSITGTAVLSASATHPQGLAARIDMQAIGLDFRSVFADALVLRYPDLHFVPPDDTLPAEADATAPVRIPLTLVGIDTTSGPGDGLSLARTPVLTGVRLRSGTTAVPGQRLLFDTGAQTTVISTSLAKALGLNLAEPQLFADLDGVAGGARDVPGFVLDELSLPGDDGRSIRFRNLPVFVLDVAPGVDGVLGMNAFNTAKRLLYDPFDRGGPSLSVTFLRDTSGRGEVGTTVTPIDLLQALGGSFVGAVQGTGLPGFDVNPNALRGQVFRDQNRNGLRDAGEPGLPGRIVYLDANGNGRLDPGEQRTTTDAAGAYAFVGLPAGPYHVRTVTPPGDAATGTRAATLGRDTVVTADIGAAVDPDAAFVASLYRQVLNRAPDAGGLSAWAGALGRNLTHAQVARAFWDSAEHRGLEVDQLYARLLHRAADAAGRQFWVAAFRRGAGERDSARGMLLSAEYAVLHPTSISFVASLYADVLGRPADPTGARAWESALRLGSRTTVAQAFLASSESFLRTLDRLFADLLLL